METTHCGQCSCSECQCMEYATQSDLVIHLPAARHADDTKCASLREGLIEWQKGVASDGRRFCSRGHEEK